MDMSLNRAAKIILGVFSVPFLAWVLASAYFTVVGCDLPEVDSRESLPNRRISARMKMHIRP